MSEPETKQFETLLYYLRQNRGFDFSGYKRPSLMRRVNKRMQTIGLETTPITSIIWKSIRKNFPSCLTSS